MVQLTRREMIDRIAAAAMAVSAMGRSADGWSQAADAASQEDRRLLAVPDFADFRSFVRISAALTGIDATQLAPDSRVDATGSPNGADPSQAVKQAYFNLARIDLSAYDSLKREFDQNLGAGTGQSGQQLSAAATLLLKSGTPGVADLTRSIIMAWYFGVWYEWTFDTSGESDPSLKPRFTIVSAEAYTEGWIWRIAQSHAPGYSNLRFGHWAFPPGAGLELGVFELK
jgi:hypothetical protein